MLIDLSGWPLVRSLMQQLSHLSIGCWWRFALQWSNILSIYPFPEFRSHLYTIRLFITARYEEYSHAGPIVVSVPSPAQKGRQSWSIDTEVLKESISAVQNTPESAEAGLTKVARRQPSRLANKRKAASWNENNISQERLLLHEHQF